jgi:hypothetical protein|tara:strand:- start:678 stop:1592 length:915 start_codon:yes stop_codon:yes gene_type:complete
MAVSVDTVYQRVLAIANKEQRGYITPQEFNLFANQAQLDVFEQYFYDINQFNRVPGNDTEYSNMLDLLNEKISIFQKYQQSVSLDSSAIGTLPSDVYRLGTVMYTGATYPIELDEISQSDVLDLEKSALTRAKLSRPYYTRQTKTTIKIYPSILSSSTAVVNGTISGATALVVDGQSSNRSITVDDTVTGTGVSGTVTVVSLIDQNNLVLSSSQSISNDVSLTFTPSVKCNYVDKPTTASFDYTIVNGEALYNSTNSVDFELHESEETELVLKILELAGISIEDPQLYQAASQQEIKKLQQEKA